MEKKSTTQKPPAEENSLGQLELFPEKKTDPNSPNAPEDLNSNGVSSEELLEIDPINPDFFEALKNVGLRYDNGKIRLDLLPPEWEWELGEVLTYGCNKYSERNWERGMDYSKVLGPLRRHLSEFQRGHQLDKESGRHHLVHVACNALILLSYELRGIGNDNLNRRDYVDHSS